MSRSVRNHFRFSGLIFFLVLCAFSPPIHAHRRTRNKHLPYCKYDQEIVKNDNSLKNIVNISEYIFSGKITTNVELSADNQTALFSVLVKRYFKYSGDVDGADGGARRVLRVSKTLRAGEGVECRQVVRFRYSAIFIGRKSQGQQEVDVQLVISPLPISLSNLNRVNSATKGTRSKTRKNGCFKL